MRRERAANDPNTVHIWVCQISGSKTEIGARANKELAQAWVERRIDSDGRWDGSRGKKRYVTESVDHGSIELVSVNDVAAILLADP